MNRRTVSSPLVFAITLVAIAALAVSTVAQEPPAARRGLSADTAYQLGDLDHVNLFNGGLTVTLPIGQSYPVGPGFSYQLVLSYSSNGWDQDEDNGCIDRPQYSLPIPDPRATAGFGWTLHLGQLFAPDNPPWNDREFDWVYVSPDGGQHAFSTELHPNAPQSPQSNTWFTNDGTYLRLRVLGGGSCEAVSGTTSQCAKVESMDGLIREFRNFGTVSSPVWRLTRLVDRFGNDLDVRYPNANTWTLSDTHGREHTVRFTGGFPEPNSPGGRVSSAATSARSPCRQPTRSTGFATPTRRESWRARSSPTRATARTSSPSSTRRSTPRPACPPRPSTSPASARHFATTA